MNKPSLMQIAYGYDHDDPLESFRNRFRLASGKIYMDGNSLGPISRSAEASVKAVMSDWQYQAVEAWTEANPPWFTMAEDVAALMAPLMGAYPDEIIAANSTTVNLHQLLSTLYHPTLSRHRIVMDGLAFPSDRYAVHSHIQLRGGSPSDSLVTVEPNESGLFDESQIIKSFTPDVAMAVLPVVVFTTGQRLGVEKIAKAAVELGVVLLLDASHSAGALSHHLHKWNVDGAFWCGYKYLNGGPGASAGIFMHRRHHDKLPGMAGWFGVEKSRMFAMCPEHIPAMGAWRLQIGNPNILSLSPLLGTLTDLNEAGMDRLRAKSLALTDWMLHLIDLYPEFEEFEVVTPRDHARRGGHIALQHPEARSISIALRQAGVIPDFRPPNIVRLAPAPMYTRFVDVLRAITAFRRIMMSGEHHRIRPTDSRVT